MKPLKILVLGGTSVDEIVMLDKLPDPYPQTVFGKSFQMVGSTGTGKAVALKRLGHDVCLHTMLGDDEEARIQKEYFRRNGIDLVFGHNAFGTEKHINLMTKSGDRLSIFTRFGYDNKELDKEEVMSLVDKADVICLNIISYLSDMAATIKKAGKPVWVDLHDYDGKNPYYEPFIKSADYIIMSNDALKDPVPILKQFVRDGKLLAIATKGRDGSIVVDQEKNIHEYGIFDFPYVDSNGAGDSFTAGFITSFYEDGDIEKAQVMATIVAGLAVASSDIAGCNMTWDYVKSYYDNNQ